VPPASFDLSGLIGGLQAGYNWQFTANWLAGLEADFDGAGLSGGPSSSAFVLGGACCNLSSFQAKEDIEWFGTVRARLGWLPTNTLLVYGTGGFAYGHVHDEVALNIGNSFGVPGVFIDGFGFACSTPANCFAGSSSRIGTGWTAGGGFEYALSQNVSFKAEYLYVNLGHGAAVNAVAQSGFGHIPSSFTVAYSALDFNVVRLGLNWKF
jgi:outer membrane immunogenic protein